MAISAMGLEHSSRGGSPDLRSQGRAAMDLVGPQAGEEGGQRACLFERLRTTTPMRRLRDPAGVAEPLKRRSGHYRPPTMWWRRTARPIPQCRCGGLRLLQLIGLVIPRFESQDGRVRRRFQEGGGRTIFSRRYKIAGPRASSQIASWLPRCASPKGEAGADNVCPAIEASNRTCELALGDVPASELVTSCDCVAPASGRCRMLGELDTELFPRPTHRPTTVRHRQCRWDRIARGYGTSSTRRAHGPRVAPAGRISVVCPFDIGDGGRSAAGAAR